MTAPTRRGLLGAAVALSASRASGAGAAGSAALPAAAVSHPDAELIAMGAEAVRLAADYRRYTAQFLTLPKSTPAAELERVGQLADPAYDRLNELLDRAITLRASTPEGILGKARVLQFWVYFDADHNVGDEPNGFQCSTDQLAWSLLQDMTEGRAVV